MSREEVRRALDEASAAGVRDIVFTGGEPFLHPAMAEIAGDTLSGFPTTILSNGTLLTDPLVDRLAEAARGSRYSLEIRISLDAPTGPKTTRSAGKAVSGKRSRGRPGWKRRGSFPS